MTDDPKAPDFQLSAQGCRRGSHEPVPVAGHDDLIVSYKFTAENNAGNSIARLVNKPERQSGFSASGFAQNKHALAADAHAGSMQKDLGQYLNLID